MSNRRTITVFVVALLLVVLLLIGYFSFVKTREKAFMGVDLGMSKNQVIYTLGYPESFINEDGEWKKLPIKQTLRPDVNYLEKSDEWSYSAGVNVLYSYRIQPVFSSKSQTVVGIYCYTNKNNKYISEQTCPLYGLSLGTPEQSMYDKLGKPSLEDIDGLVKRVLYENLGLEVHLAKKRIFLIKLKSF